MQEKSSTNVFGIDLSHHNGKPDWVKIAKAGVKFALLKASQGTKFLDDQLKNNYNGAKSNKIEVGFYHYAVFTNESQTKAEAEHFIETVKGLDNDLPHVLDLEDAVCKALSTDALSKLAGLWLETVKNATGKEVMLYTGAYFARDELNSSLGKYPLWVAHYSVSKPLDNSTWARWTIFQYTSSGHVDGISSGNVDLNVMEKAYFDKITAENVDNIKVVINDILVGYGRNINGHIYLPIRKISEALGQEVNWDSARKIPLINGVELKNFVLINGMTYAQVREAGEQIKAKVSWDAETKKVYIYK